MKTSLYSEFDKLEASVKHLERIRIPAGWDHVSALFTLDKMNRGPTSLLMQTLKRTVQPLWDRREEIAQVQVGVIFLAELPARSLSLSGLHQWIIGAGTRFLPVDAAAVIRHGHDWNSMYYRLWDADHAHVQDIQHVVVMHEPIRRNDGRSTLMGLHMNDNHLHAYDVRPEALWIKKTTAVLVAIPDGHSCLVQEAKLDEIHSN